MDDWGNVANNQKHDIFVNCDWGCHPVAVVQYTFTHKQYTEWHKANNTQNNIKILEECGACPVLAGYTLAFALQLRKKAWINLSQGSKLKFKTRSNQKCNRNRNERVNYFNTMVWQYMAFVDYGLPHEQDLRNGCLSGHWTWFQQGHRTRPYSHSARGISAACPAWKLAASASTCNSQFTKCS